MSKQWAPDLPVRERSDRGEERKRDNERVNVKGEKTQKRIKRETENKTGRDGCETQGQGSQ